MAAPPAIDSGACFSVLAIMVSPASAFQKYQFVRPGHVQAVVRLAVSEAQGVFMLPHSTAYAPQSLARLSALLREASAWHIL